MNSPKAAPVAVEAAEREAFIKWRQDNFLNPPKWDEVSGFQPGIDYAGYEAWKGGRAALRAALTSQQEVAAPVGDALSDDAVIAQAKAAGFTYLPPDPDIDGDGTGFPGGFDLEHGLESMRRLLSASRDQVNLAACGGGGATQWQPIATAPMYTPVRLYAQGGGFHDEDFNPSGSVEGFLSDDGNWCGAFWNPEQDCWDRRDGIVPTHWMPLPAAPKAQEGGK